MSYACRLIRKAQVANTKLVVLAEDREQLNNIDSLLWTFSEQDFLPHVIAGDSLAAQTPIILTDDCEKALPHHHALVNLSRRTPEFFARFERMFELVSNDEQDLVAGRERYKYYQERGYPLTHHVADSS
ncbi:MAG: DNA polymerase III subunit chi [Oxalobacteraceae bacterium]|nr:DNA polymerase III subunit chi [Oxalobacteraceae bacterium]